MTAPARTPRLAELARLIEDERPGYGDLVELAGLADTIDDDDVLLLQWAGVPELHRTAADAETGESVCGDPLVCLECRRNR